MAVVPCSPAFRKAGGTLTIGSAPSSPGGAGVILRSMLVAAVTVWATALCERPAGSLCTTATRLRPGRANSLAEAISVLSAGAPDGVMSLDWPLGNDGRYRNSSDQRTRSRASGMRKAAGPAVTHA